ncbi:ABC-type organic solvent resistance transporter, permease protein [Bdellovibrio bacteriovorus W]|nr:ABC-type organic solvent resistance transporter, permease protein [Bdellovibrio bacteriovorus W]
MMKLLSEVGAPLIFLSEILKTLFKKKISVKLVLEQIWSVAWNSLPTTAMAGFFVGAIMSVQFALQMKEFGALGYLGGLATSGTFREIGPLLIAFMLSGKVGAFTSAELGTMRVTEQIDAIRCLGADPLQELIVPRFLGIIISSFFLLGLGLLMSVLGGAFLASLFVGVHVEEYLRHIPRIVQPASIVLGLIKCGSFALILATICTYKGFFATGGAKGVGRAVVQTAVSTMICIVVADWFTSFVGDVLVRLVIGEGA